MTWRAQLQSGYRGLRLNDGPLEVRDLTVVVGPNNGGKSQYLRSLVLVDAARQVLSSWGATGSSFLFEFGTKTRVSLAQVLMDTGFRDLADETAELMEKGRKLTLIWRGSVPDYASLTDVGAAGRAQIQFAGRTASMPEAPKKTREISLEITLALDRSTNDIIIQRCAVTGLWGEHRVVIVPRKRPGRPSKLGNPIERLAESMEAQWFVKDVPIDTSSLRTQWNVSDASPHHFSSEFESGIALSHIYRVIFSAMPRVTFIGPIRLVDDRQYHVDQGTLVGVGPRGELTWVQLKELERLPKKFRDWFTSNVRSVLDLQNIKTKRDSPTRPKVTARLGNKDIGLHSFGLGTSQALPILVQMAVSLGKRDRPLEPWGGIVPPAILIIEEPESHLHPRAQRALARALAEYVARGGRILVETHSEIILRSIEAEIASRTVPSTSAVVDWVDARHRRGKKTQTVRTFKFGKDGALAGDLPPSFDRIVPELIEERILRG